MHHFTRLNKIFWRILFTKLGLLFTIVSFCMLLTIFAGAVLVMDYDWSMLTAALVCLAPWLIAIISLYIMFLAAHKEYHQEKEELMNNGRNILVVKLITYAIQFILARRRKAKAERSD